MQYSQLHISGAFEIPDIMKQY